MRALVPLGIRWFTETDISVADDDELLDLMCESGRAQILIGLEFDVNFQPDRMTVAELETGLRELGGKVYNEDFTAFRRANFWKQVKEARRAERALNNDQ